MLTDIVEILYVRTYLTYRNGWNCLDKRVTTCYLHVSELLF